MQVENNKEQVPFEHYVARFERADAKEMAARTGVKWDGKEFYIELLGEGYGISHPEYGIRRADQVIGPYGQNDRKAHCPAALPTDPCGDRDGTIPGDAGCVEKQDCVGAHCQPALPALPVQTFLLRFLLEGKAVISKGGWKTFREMPWGELYIKPYTGRVLTRAAFTFGTRVAAFRAACEKMGATPLSHGDAGYQLRLLGDYQMQVMVWEGDDEFPPNAQILYSDNFEDGFAPEDRVVAGDLLITAIKAKM